MKDQDPEDEQNIWDPGQEDQVDQEQKDRDQDNHEQKDQDQDNWDQKDQMQVDLY